MENTLRLITLTKRFAAAVRRTATNLFHGENNVTFLDTPLMAFRTSSANPSAGLRAGVHKAAGSRAEAHSLSSRISFTQADDSQSLGLALSWAS